MMRPARFSLASELWLFATAICLFLAGCASLTRSDAVPADQQHRATVLGWDDLRYWADQEDQSDFRRDAEAALAREQKWRQASGQKRPLPTAEFLAISGGGEDGAFGAGLLVGWTAAGTRPQFKGVTGISTGALTAPPAFLGSDYDEELRAVYTTISADDVCSPGDSLRPSTRTPWPTPHHYARRSPATSIKICSTRLPTSTPRVASC